MTTNARLRALVELADTGSVRAAAQRLRGHRASCPARSARWPPRSACHCWTATAAASGSPPPAAATWPTPRILGLHEEALAAPEARPTGTRHPAAGRRDHGRRAPAAHAAGVVPREYPAVVLGLEVAPRQAVWPKLATTRWTWVVAGRPPADGPARVRAVRPQLAGRGRPTERGSSVRPASVTCCCASRSRDPGDHDRAAVRAGDRPAPAHARLARRGGGRGRGRARVTLVSRPAVRAHLESGALVELAVRARRCNGPGTWSASRRRPRPPSCSSTTCWPTARLGGGHRDASQRSASDSATAPRNDRIWAPHTIIDE